MDLRQLRYFLAVVDRGGFTRAAAAVHVAQPSLSQAIRGLERELGVALFERLGRTVRLTAAGEALVEPARQTLRDVRTAVDAVRAVGGLEAGHLDVVCLPTLAVSPVAGYVATFRHRHPGVKVRLMEPEDAGSVTAMLRSGEAEVGFTDLPLETTDLELVELAPQEYVVVASTSMGLGPGAVALAALAELPLVTTSRGTSTRRLVDEAFGRDGITPSVAIATDHREVIGAMVRSGAGYSILPRPVAEGIARRDAEVVELRPRLSRRIAVVVRSGVRSPAASALLSIVTEGWD